MTRTPSGHPEGYLEGFANIYAEVARAIRAAATGAARDPAMMFPIVEDGVKAVAFIAAAVESSTRGSVWVDLRRLALPLDKLNEPAGRSGACDAEELLRCKALVYQRGSISLACDV